MNQKQLERLAEIESRLKGARPGKWEAVIEGRDHQSGSSFIQIGEGNQRGEDLYLTGDENPVPIADYDFIANAKEDIEFLLDIVKTSADK